MATQKRNLKGNRNNDGDFMSIDAMDAISMSTQDMIDAGIPVHEPMVQMDEPPERMDEPPLDLTEAIRRAPFLENNLGNERENKAILSDIQDKFGFKFRTELLQSPEFQEIHGDKYNDLAYLGGKAIIIEKGPTGDEGKKDWNKMPDRNKTVDPKPGWHKNEGSNFWNVDSESPYWQTEEGYQEAMKLWGVKPGWIKRPSAKKEKVDFKPTKRISL